MYLKKKCVSVLCQDVCVCVCVDWVDRALPNPNFCHFDDVVLNLHLDP